MIRPESGLNISYQFALKLGVTFRANRSAHMFVELTDNTMKLISQLLREPLLHFLILGMIIFVLSDVVGTNKKEQIVITPALTQYLFKHHQQLRLKVLSEKDKKQILDDYIKEEMLYREAYHRGLDKGDSRIRQLLVRKMYGVIQQSLPEPSEQELRAFYLDNPELFSSPATLTLEQVYFKHADDIPDFLLTTLNSGASFLDYGENMSNFGRVIRNVTPAVLSRELGAKTANDIQSTQHQLWFGPTHSRYGVHFFRITQRHEPVLWRYEDVSREIGQLWFQFKSEKLLNEELQHIANSYDIVYQDWTDE